MYSEKKQALAAELSLKRPAVLAVSGAHNSGKTTLLEKLIPLLRARGLKVGVIKHDGHDFTPDVPGTDSFRLREAGAEGVAVFSGSRYLLTEEFRLNEQDLLALNNALSKPVSTNPENVAPQTPEQNAIADGYAPDSPAPVVQQTSARTTTSNGHNPFRN